MAISQIGKGVFLVKPDKFKRYQDTAAGKYVSVFTKARADQWERSLKEAERKAGVKEFEYKAKLELYRDRLRQQERELADLQKLRIQVLNGEVKAEDAAIALGVKVEQSNVREQNKRDEAVAAQGAIVVGTTVSEGGGVGGGGRRADPTAISTVNKDELGKAKDEASPSDPAALAAAVRTRLDNRSFVTTTEVEADAIRHGAVEEMVQDQTSRIMTEDPAITYDKARNVAAGKVKDTLSMGNRDFFDAYRRVESQVDAADATAGTPRKTTTTRRKEFYQKYKNLDTEARRALEGGPTTIPAVPIAGREAVLEALDKAEQKIRERAIEAPTLGADDVITEARRIFAGRFGPRMQDQAFERRNALDRMSVMSDEEFEKLRAEAAATLPSRAPITPPETAVSGTEAEPRGTEVIPPPTPAPLSAGGSGMGEAFPYEEQIVAAEQRGAAAPPPQPPEPAEPRITPEPAQPRIAPEPQIRPEAAALMTPAEIADFKRRLQNRADMAELMRQQAAEMDDIAGPSDAYREASIRPMSPPAALPRPERPQMEAPRSVAEAMVMPSIPVPPPPSIGSYTPGPVPLAGPRPSGPSSADAAPRTPAAAPEGFLDRPSRPGAAQLGADIAIREASKPKVATAGILQEDTRPSVGRYFSSRALVADKLADQPDKIKRLTSSGPGRVASDIYKANKSNGIDFKSTWQEIQMTFADDRASMERAHEIALALDMMDEDAKKPKE
jgi:hypothetical protein